MTYHLSVAEQRVLRKALKQSVKIVATPADLEYLSWSGYRPDGTCPRCGEAWSDVCFAYDGPHCTGRLAATGRSA